MSAPAEADRRAWRRASASSVTCLTLVSPLAASFCAVLIGVGAISACVAGGAGPSSAVVQASPPISPVASGAAWVIVNTVGLAALVATVATVLAVPVAWAMRGRGTLLAVATAATLLVPNYLVYASWGMLRGPGTALGDWLESAATPTTWSIVRWVQVSGAMSLWSWPLAALALAPSASRIETSTLDAMRLTGAGPLRKSGEVLSQMRGGLAVAFGLVALVMLGSAVPVHICQIETWSVQVWRALQETGGSAEAWRTGIALMFVTSVGGLLAGMLALRRDLESCHGSDNGIRRGGGCSAAVAVVIWAASVMVPAVILATHLRQVSSLRRFLQESAEPLAQSAVLATVVAAITALVGASSAAGFGMRDQGHRLARAALLIWVAIAAIPGVLVGSAVLSAASVSTHLAWIAETELGLTVSHVARFGVVGALAGWWVARSEPRDLRDLRRSSPGGIGSWWATIGPRGTGTLIAGALGAGSLSLHEIEAAVVVSPPGVRTLSQHMLDLLHYLREEQLIAGTLWLLAISVSVAVICVMAASRGVVGGLSAVRRMTPCLIVALTLALSVPGCSRPNTDDTPLPLPKAEVLGETGRSPGQFIKPRVVETDGERLYVIDMTGRCQSFGLDGTLWAWWDMPSQDRGKPTGMTFQPAVLQGGIPEAQLLVADSHEHRIAWYAPPRAGGGNLNPIVHQLGGYGREPGRFTFPSDVLLIPGRTPELTRIYVSEYGGNDRISVFDIHGGFLFSIGSEGDGKSGNPVQFRRPQSLAWDAESQTLIVADACNHRVGLLTKEGELKRWLGRPGAAPGQAPGEFHYPYGLCLLPDRTLLVCEQGNARVQRIDIVSGRSLAVYGRRGRGKGELDAPWGICYARGRAFVADAGNHRVQVFEVPGMTAAPHDDDAPAATPGIAGLRRIGGHP